MNDTQMSADILDGLIRSRLVAGDVEEAQALLARLESGVRKTRLQALVALSQGDYQGAADGYRTLLDSGQAQARDKANLGMALLRAGQPEEAVAPLRQAVTDEPDNSASQYSLVSALMAAHAAAPADQRDDLAAQALAVARTLTRQAPGQALYVCALADACRLNRRWRAALRLYGRALKLDDTLVSASINLIVILSEIGVYRRAIRQCQALLEKHPGHVRALQYLGDAYLATEQPDEAMNAYADAYEQSPDDAELCTRIGHGWLHADNDDEALTWFERALSIDPQLVKARVGLAESHRGRNDPAAALALLGEIESEQQDNADFLISLGESHWDEGDAELALACFRKAQALEPQRIALYSRIGRVLSSAGDVDGALEQYRQGLAINGDNVPCLGGMATTLKGKLEPALAEKIESLLTEKNYRDQARSTLSNGLAFFHEGQKDYEKAAYYSRMANECQWRYKSKSAWSYDPDQHTQHVERLMACYDEDYFARIPGRRSDSEAPVFIVSMPRSGTTLTEQILARHGSVLGIGERDFAGRGFHAFRDVAQLPDLNKSRMLAALSRVDLRAFANAHLHRFDELVAKAGETGITRVVDKMPDNYHLLGWIKTLFPRARLIHIRRDPRDVALSCWMTQFASIPWACQPEHLVRRIADYQTLMRHWRKVLGDDLLEIRYEDLVADQEAVSRQLIDWIGLEWDEKCLSFYESDRLVRTASITQVRQPIYKRSVKKWEHYMPWLEDLLGPIEDRD